MKNVAPNYLRVGIVILGIALLRCSSSPAHAAPTPPHKRRTDSVPLSQAPGNQDQGNDQSLVLLAQARSPAVHDAPVSYDIGTVTRASNISHTFVVRNAGATLVMLERLQPSCGCTSTTLDGIGKGLPLLLQPNQQVEVEVTVTPTSLPLGPIQKEVWVYLQGQASPAATLQIDGLLKTGVSFSPAILDFDKAALGTNQSMLLNMTVDPKLVPDYQSLHLVASSPGIAVTELSVAHTTKKTAFTRSFRVRLTKDAYLGQFSSTLLLLPAPQATGQTSIPLATVPVVGEVTGELSASPSTATFGMVPTGRSSSLHITLTAAAPSNLQGLSVSSAYRDVVARLLPAAPDQNSAHPYQCVLEVTANPHFIGTLETQVFVTTAGGQQLLLPVTMSVAKTTP